MRQIPEYLAPIAKILDFASFGEFDGLIDLIARSNKGDLLNALAEVAERLPRAKVATLGYDFFADASLSGLGPNCMSTSCRFDRLSELVGFASLYSDQVVVRNPAQFALMQGDFDSLGFTNFELNEFAVGIFSILTLSPLIDYGIVTFSDIEESNLCRSCLSNLLDEVSVHTLQSAEDEKTELYKNLYADILENSTVKFLTIDPDGDYECIIQSREGRFEHAELIMSGWGPDSVIKKYSVGEYFTNADVHELGIHQRHVDMLFSDVVARSVAADSHKIKHHLSSESEVAVISAIVGKDRISSAFSPAFPFLSSMNVDGLLSLRENEWHHFESFRKQVFNASKSIDLGETDVAEVMREQITPEMAKLEKVIEKSRRSAGKNIIDNSGIAALAIGTSIATSGISTLLASAVGVLGSGHFTAKMVPALRKRLEVPDEALENDYYFAYRVKKILD